MKQAKLRVRKYHHSTTSKWVVGWKENGKRRRDFFPTKETAETWVAQKEIELQNHGIKALTMSDELRVMASGAAAKLSPFGKTLDEAVDHYVKHLEACQRSCSINDLVAKFIAGKVQAERSASLLATIKSRLGRFQMTFGDRLAATIQTTEIDDWLHDIELAAETRNNLRREVVGLFNYGVKRKFAESNPALATERVRVTDAPPGILSLDEIARLLEVASPQTLPFFAIGAFAGLRTAEIKMLDWRNVDLADGLIQVEAKTSKTKQGRFVKIQPNLAAWLAPLAKKSGSVVPPGLRKRSEADRRTAGFGAPGSENDAEKKAGVKLKPWPDNALRHSYGSYHLAHFKNADELALEMGNSVGMVFRHYRKIVTPAAAATYWQIAPAKADNIVALHGTKAAA